MNTVNYQQQQVQTSPLYPLNPMNANNYAANPSNQQPQPQISYGYSNFQPFQQPNNGNSPPSNSSANTSLNNYQYQPVYLSTAAHNSGQGSPLDTVASSTSAQPPQQTQQQQTQQQNPTRTPTTNANQLHSLNFSSQNISPPTSYSSYQYQLPQNYTSASNSYAGELSSTNPTPTQSQNPFNYQPSTGAQYSSTQQMQRPMQFPQPPALQYQDPLYNQPPQLQSHYTSSNTSTEYNDIASSSLPDLRYTNPPTSTNTYSNNYGYQRNTRPFAAGHSGQGLVSTNPYGYVNTPQPTQLQTQPPVLGHIGIGMKRDYDDANLLSNEKQSSIAGIIYNSSAVFKRLKPSLAEEKSEMIYKEESNRSQGRPFSSNLTGRFIFHDSLKSLLNHVDKKNNNNFVVYDMKKHIIPKQKDDSGDGKNGKNANEEKNKLPISTKKERKQDINSREGFHITQLLFKNLRESLSNNDMIRMGYMNQTKLSSEITMNALDNFLNCKHDDILRIDGYREQYTPVQKTISYNPKKQKEQQEREMREAGREELETKSGLENINKRFNFHSLIKENFGLEEYVFVKTIRDNNGHILKLETIKPPVDKDGKYNYTSEWLKRRICYPRYKGGMNLHILNSSFNFILYNDIKMLLWDIKEEILSRNDEEHNDKILDQTDVIVDDDLRQKLFGNKVVYTQTLDRQ